MYLIVGGMQPENQMLEPLAQTSLQPIARVYFLFETQCVFSVSVHNENPQ